MKLNLSRDYIVSFLVVILALSFVWFFTNIFVYMIVAALIALTGRPVKKLIMKIPLGKKHPGNGLASAVALLVLIAVITGVIMIIVPSVVAQADDLNSLNYKEISHNLQTSLASLEGDLKKLGILEKNDKLDEVALVYLKDFVAKISFNQMATNTISFIGSMFMGVFSVLFFTFFFISDEMLFHKIILLFVPLSKQKSFAHILLKIRKMLSRYFVGLMIEVGSMMILISIGGLILGLKNALLIGFLGGLMNIIPYIGPLIGASIGAVLVTISNINNGLEATLPLVWGILAVFVIANLIDNFLLQPLIYSNSVKAHPLEIFVVIIVGGSVAGPMGMILAIPIYTILRVVTGEFFSDQHFVQKVTKDL